MKPSVSASLIINGHFRQQQVTGVQRYALELIQEFDRMDVNYRYEEPPGNISSDTLRQLWMQLMMPLKLNQNSLLWSPTNIGPVYHKKQVVTLHDIADQLHPQWFSSKYVNWRKFILPRLIKNVEGIITVSEYSKQTIRNTYPEAGGKVKVIYNGVRTGHFYPRPANEAEAVKQKFTLEKPFIVTVGSLDPRKNIGGLIKAWNMLPSHIRAELDLVIAGGSADKFQFTLEENIDSSVRFLGYVDYGMLPALYTASDFFVYPSLFEGFGLPVLEAMACKTPVITSDTTSLAEIAGDSAYTVDPEKPEEIGTAIEKFYESEETRKRYVSKGYEKAKMFRWSNAAQETVNFLENVADEN